MEKAQTSIKIHGKGLINCKIPDVKEPQSITSLDLSGNKIRSGEGLEQFSKLQSLNLDKNQIVSLETFPTMPNLRILSLENNKLEEIYETIKYIKQKFPSLQSLNLQSNPLNPKSKPEQYSVFRNRIRDNLEQVAVLDGTPLERADNGNDPVAAMLREANRKQKEGSEGQKVSSVIIKEEGKKSTIMIKKKAVVKATIENLSERILKSHSEGNRFITNDDL